MNKTKLIIRRFVVKSNSRTVYDEEFHKGLNVIRGDNSTGKTTIMELLSYSLGGDIKKGSWKKEALECTEVRLALSINKRNFVFKRAIEDEASHPQIKIFEGDYEKSIEESEGWQSYKYRRSDTRKSFSEQIFELLGLESHTTNEDDSLTIHQLLRIIYIDQDTPASKIFRTEPFVYDRESMRKAIGEYSFGFDDLEAHSLRQKLYKANKKFEKIDDELKSIYKLLEITQVKATTIEVSSELDRLNEDFQRVEKKRLELQTEQLTNKSRDMKDSVKKLQTEIEQETRIFSDLKSKLNYVSYDISDNTRFLETLSERKKALRHAGSTNRSLSQMIPEFCPCCHTKIHKSEDDGTHCLLCKSDIEESALDKSYIQALDELDFQLQETSQVLELRQKEKTQLEAETIKKEQSIFRLKAELRELNSYSSDYEIRLSQISSEKGFIQAQIENLKEKLSLAGELDRKANEKAQLQSQITELEEQLKAIESAHIRRVNSVKNQISSKVVDILARDNGTEDAFKDAKKFEFDFSSDSMRLDGRANFSASSNVVLKNAFHVAVLHTSITDSQFRIPCFSMFDNIEDKGMREERSHNFQNIILEEFSELGDDFQLIMTTSMVASSLNNKDFGVGPYYSIGEHTLKFG